MLKRRATWGAGHLQVIAATALALLGGYFLAATLTLAQNAQNHGDSPLAAKVRAFNNQLLQLHGQMQQGASGNTAEGVRAEAAAVIAARAAALTSLIEGNPRAALSLAFSSELLADLAAKFPQSASLLESQTTVRGQLQRWVADAADMKSSRSYFFLNTGSQTVGLYFAKDPMLKSGEVLTVTGVLLGSKMAVLSAETAGESSSTLISGSQELVTAGADFVRGLGWPVLAVGLFLLAFVRLAREIRRFAKRSFAKYRQCAACAAALSLIVLNPGGSYGQTACSTTGVQHVAVLLVTFPGITVPTFSPSLNDQFFGPAPSLTDYWQEASYGATSATGNVFGPYTLAGTYSCSNFTALMNDALIAAEDAVDFNTYNRVEIVFPDLTPSCGWAGFSTVGCSSFTTTTNHTYNVSISLLVWTKLQPSVIFHEGGHQLGLDHAHGLKFSDTNQALGSLADAGTISEYGDNYSAMSAGVELHYAAGHKADQLGWLTAGTSFQNVSSSGTYTVEPYELQTAGVRALKIQRGTSNPGYSLWVEYRQPLGNYDTTSLFTSEPNGNVFSGALIHYESPVTANADLRGTYLLDFTIPDTYGDFPALLPGQTWTDPYSDLSLSVISATSSGLTLNVSYSGNEPCVSSSPSVAVSPLNPSIYPGQSASYSVSVTNNDSTMCGASTISLGSTEPSGWTTALSSPSVTLSPGQSASVTMGKGVPAGALAGTYAVNLSASSTSATTTDTANATVMTPPALAVIASVSGTSFVPPGTVPITASVTTGGSPASGASVAFTLIAPNGSATTQTATAGTNGLATWNYKLNSKSLVGSYSVSTQAALGFGSGGKKTNTGTNAQTATSNTVSFSVQ